MLLPLSAVISFEDSSKESLVIAFFDSRYFAILLLASLKLLLASSVTSIALLLIVLFKSLAVFFNDCLVSLPDLGANNNPLASPAATPIVAPKATFLATLAFSF